MANCLPLTSAYANLYRKKSRERMQLLLHYATSSQGLIFLLLLIIFDKEKIKVYRGRPLVLEPRDVHKADRQQYNGGLVFFAVVLRDVTFPFKAVLFLFSHWDGREHR